MFLVRIVLFFLAFALSITARAEVLDGRRAIIIDGDTLAFGLEQVRILNIDAPESFRSRCEREHIAGLKAKEGLTELLRAGPVSLERHG